MLLSLKVNLLELRERFELKEVKIEIIKKEFLSVGVFDDNYLTS